MSFLRITVVSSPYQVRINFGQQFLQKNKEHSIQNAPYIFFIKTCQRHLIYNHLCRRRVFTNCQLLIVNCQLFIHWSEVGAGSVVLTFFIHAEGVPCCWTEDLLFWHVVHRDRDA